jgi:hypothetical protein
MTRNPDSMAVSLDQYIETLKQNGERIFPAGGEGFWTKSEFGCLTRRPDHLLDPPPLQQVKRLLWQSRLPLASYVRYPDPQHPANAWLYLCRDPEYHIDKLDRDERRKVRCARRNFRFDFLDHRTLADHGVAAFCDTLGRHGLSGATPKAFGELVAAHARLPGHRIVGAWCETELAAFFTLEVIHDWVDIFPYAANARLQMRPVNGLMDFMLDYFLTQGHARYVSCGLSSIQETSKADTLHRFKRDVGFETIPVHRAFVFHPLLAPLANRVTLWGLRGLRTVRPGSAAIRKAAGVLATHLGHNFMPADSRQPAVTEHGTVT